MVFQYHDQVDGEDRLESKVETDVAEPQGEDRQGDDELEEDDWLSEVGSYVTAEDSEVDIRMDVDEVDLVYEELESWPEQVHHQSSLEASELTNLYVLYSDRENIRYVNDSTTEVDADVGVDFSSRILYISLILVFHAYLGSCSVISG